MDSSENLPDRPEGRSYGVPARRAQVIELLSEAYARNDLEQAELERRLDLAESARTIEEIEKLVADFPEHMRAVPGRAAVTEGGARLTGTALEHEIVRLDGLAAPTSFNLIGDGHITLRRDAPRVARTVSIIGDCNVDLRPLAGEPGAVLVKVVAFIGDTRIIVPRGTHVDLRLTNLIGDQTRAKQGGGLIEETRAEVRPCRRYGEAISILTWADSRGHRVPAGRGHRCSRGIGTCTNLNF